MNFSGSELVSFSKNLTLLGICYLGTTDFVLGEGWDIKDVSKAERQHMLKCNCGLSLSLNSSMISNLNPLYTEEGRRQNPLLALPPSIPGLRSFYAKNSHSGALSLFVLHHVLAVFLSHWEA